MSYATVKKIKKFKQRYIQARLIFWEYLAISEVLNFKKLNAEEKNPQTKNHIKEENL